MIAALDVRTARTRRRLVAILGLLITLGLLALSIERCVQQQQVNTLYDPVYRWRQTFVVALSRMREHPPGGYLGFKSIESVFVHNGFGILPGEDVDMGRVTARQKDGAFLNRVLAEAMAVPINRSEAPILIRGNDLGWVDYVYLSFAIFGLNVSSLFYFYYLLLGLSAAMFLGVFWRSSASLYVLSMYLIGHYLLIGYIKDLGEHYLVSVTNSRFYSAAALLPALHILLVILRREAPTLRTICCTAVQTALLMFYAFCRLEVAWLPMMLAGVAALTLPYRQGWRLLTSRASSARWNALRASWAAAVVLLGCFGLLGYMRYAPAQDYGREVKTHVFWHSLYAQLVSVLAESHPSIKNRYLHGNVPGSDNVAYQAVLEELRARNDASSPIAFRSDGVIYIDPMRDMGVYDAMVRSLYLSFIKKHPLLLLESFYDNIYDEYDTVSSVLRRSHDQLREGVIAFVLSASVALLFLGYLLPKIEAGGTKRFLAGTACLAGAALIPVVTVEDPLLCGTILVYSILPLAAVTAVPLAAARWLSTLADPSARPETPPSPLAE
ncbi:MAG: hypothetical protein ACLQJR_03435 [Stellaceae bacterium]